MILQRIIVGLVLASSIAAAVMSAYAAPFDELGSTTKTVSISNNSGGNVALFAMNVADYRSVGTLVKFNGRCDSACTMYLGLPTSQTCISQGAYFRFHSPSGASVRSNRIAQSFLMNKYPGWVRAWIGRSGGLSSTLMTMDYSYASKFLRTCNRVASP